MAISSLLGCPTKSCTVVIDGPRVFDRDDLNLDPCDKGWWTNKGDSCLKAVVDFAATDANAMDISRGGWASVWWS